MSNPSGLRVEGERRRSAVAERPAVHRAGDVRPPAPRVPARRGVRLRTAAARVIQNKYSNRIGACRVNALETRGGRGDSTSVECVLSISPMPWSAVPIMTASAFVHPHP